VLSSGALRHSLFVVRPALTGLLAALLSLVCASAAFAAAPETPETKPASEVTSSSATLNGVVNPLSEASVGYDFAYAPSASECTGGPSTEPVAEAPVKALEVAVPVSGLEPNRDYTFCLVATNLVEGVPGSTSGAALSFKTLALPPTVDGESASAVGSTAVTLEAQVNPNNEATTFSFEYATSEDLKGATTVAGPEPLAAEFGDRLATVPRVEGLTPGTTYFYRVVAENAQSEEAKEAVLGAVQSFTTPPLPFTDPVTAVTTTSATLNGHLTLSPVESQFSFAYNIGEACSGAFAVAAEPASGIGAGESVETAQVGELEPNALYTACFQTQNTSGSQLGERVQFKTLPAPPSITAETASNVTDTTANLESQINPNNQETVFRWRLSTEGAIGGSLEGELKTFLGAAPLTGFGSQPANVTVKGLAPRTKYYYRVATENTATSEEEAAGEVQAFTTLDKPLATTAAAEGVTRTQATLSGRVNPGGLEASYHFVYVDAAHYQPGSEECASPPCAYTLGSATQIQQAGSDYSDHETGPVQIGELKAETTYDYALVASNSLGTRVGANQQFTTLPATPPTVTTGEALGVSPLSATITGSVDTRGIPTTMQFELLTAGTPVGQGALMTASAGEQAGTTVAISLHFPEDLQPSTTYYYRAIATNADGIAAGSLLSFTTAALPTSAGFTFTASPPLLRFPSIAELEAKEAREAAEHPFVAHLTNKQKLAKALKACKRQKGKTRRLVCERHAHKRYGSKRKK
jgi:hypothetical protein